VASCEKVQGGKIEGDGIRFFPDNKMGDQFFDVLVFTEHPYRMVLLNPLQQKHEGWLRRFQDRSLSRRELEVAHLAVQGMPNSGISKRLFISKATLKTHLNNIYKKMPEIRNEGWRKNLPFHPPVQALEKS
jgi:hypothetical protein